MTEDLHCPNCDNYRLILVRQTGFRAVFRCPKNVGCGNRFVASFDAEENLQEALQYQSRERSRFRRNAVVSLILALPLSAALLGTNLGSMGETSRLLLIGFAVGSAFALGWNASKADSETTGMRNEETKLRIFLEQPK